MDDLTFSARRATATKPETENDLDTRFRNLVQSPLRAGILRYLSARPEEGFDADQLMQTFGRLRLDVENCVRELVGFGVVNALPGTPARYAAARPENPGIEKLLDRFLERRATISTEDQSPSVQRFREMIGRDEKMLIVFEWIRTAAKSDISVLILGPTGSGKELVARMIHELSRRQTAKFQAVNCAALPDTLFESEIFGYEKGAFTGAHDRKPGRLEMANEGTLFLDEIGDLSIVAQAKLLRVLEERRFERLGGNKSIHVDFRLISATNRPLDQFVRDGRFREDLYYRINVIQIVVPPLRERTEEIPFLISYFIERHSRLFRREGFTVPPDVMEVLTKHNYPGNVREVENLVKRMIVLGDPSLASAALAPRKLESLAAGPPRKLPVPSPSLKDVARQAARSAEREAIAKVLEDTRWNRVKAAKLLRISYRALLYKIKDVGLDRSRPESPSPN